MAQSFETRRFKCTKMSDSRYNERAERDKERYSREWEKYIETDEYKNYVAEADAKAEVLFKSNIFICILIK